MSRSSLHIIPDGGMANRMRAIASAVSMAAETGRRAVIIWKPDALCNVRLSDIFDTSGWPAKIIQPSPLKFALLYELPRRRNLYVTRLTAPLLFGRSYRRKFIYSGLAFHDFSPRLYRSLFRFTPAVVNRAETILEGAPAPATAFQIRRTDNAEAIAHSPTELFFRKMRLTQGAFFLATDSEEVKRRARAEFGNRVIFNSVPANRSTPRGILDAMAEMLILSRAEIIYGSYWSSFAEAAAMLGHSGLEILHND